MQGIVILLILSLPVDFQKMRFLIHKMDSLKWEKLTSLTAYEDTSRAFDLTHYTVDMRVSPQVESIYASNAITGVSRADTLTTLILHLDGLIVDSILRDSEILNFSRDDTLLIVYLGDTLRKNDTFQVVVYYHGKPIHGGGVFGGGLTIEEGIVFADNEPWGAKRWIPCYDDPAEKVTSELIVTVPENWVLIANGTLLEVDTLDSLWRYHWKEDYPIATYLIVFAASPNYAIWSDTFNYGNYSMPVYTCVLREDSSLAAQRFSNTRGMLEFFSDVFALYPFINEKYAHVYAPIGGAMENQTNTFIFIPWPGNDWDGVVSHELAHQWWGDWVTLGTWADIWLNEGFATYSEALWYGQREGPSAYFEYMRAIMDIYINYAPYPPYPIYDPVYLFSVVTYEKGASVLHMLRYLVGDSLFFEILREYGSRFSYGNAVTSEFQEVSEEISGMDLDWFFDEWVYLPGHPEYRYGWSAREIAPDSFLIILHINQTQGHAFGVPTFKMPIEIGIKLASGDTLFTTVWDSLDEQSFTFYTKEEPINLYFDPHDWILKKAYYYNIAEGNKKEGKVVSFFPNPAREKLILLLPSSGDATSITFFDISGKKVKTIKKRSKEGRISITKGELFSLPNGTYFLRIGKEKKLIGPLLLLH